MAWLADVHTHTFLLGVRAVKKTEAMPLYRPPNPQAARGRSTAMTAQPNSGIHLTTEEFDTSAAAFSACSSAAETLGHIPCVDPSSCQMADLHSLKKTLLQVRKAGK